MNKSKVIYLFFFDLKNDIQLYFDLKKQLFYVYQY